MFAGLILFLTLLPLQAASAKGRFAMLSVCGERGDCFEVRDPSLLDFRAFTDFSETLLGRPDALGESFHITRYGRDSRQEEYIAVDRLTYYASPAPERNVVFYDGLVNGRSEYDGRWYAARPEVNAELLGARTAGDRGVGAEMAWAAPLAALVGIAVLVRRRLRTTKAETPPPSPNATPITGGPNDHPVAEDSHER